MKVVYLLIVLMLGVTSCKRESTHNSPPSQTEVAIGKLMTALDAFEVDCGRFPPTAESLSALVTRPTNVPESQWHGPYLTSIPKDPWGHDFVYRCPGIHNTNQFDFYSCGPDGVSKTGGNDPDDIPNWDTSK